MKASLNNIVSFNKQDDNFKREFNTEVYDQIMRFLREHSRASKNTVSAYERDIRQFFFKMKSKEIEHLVREDLEYSIEKFEDYQAYLIDELKLSVSTSNRHISSISECMRHLKRRGLVDKIDFLNIKRPTFNAESYDRLTREEVLKAADFVLTTGRKNTASIKHQLIRFTYDTCMRLEECLQVKWNDFGEPDDSNWIPVRTVGKGKKIMNRKISLELYNDLLAIKEDEKDKVFNVSVKTVRRMMEDIKKELKIDPEKRKIVFHSIRKAGAQYIWEKTRDMNQVRLALGHSSIQTTEIYIEKNEDYGIVGAISDESSVDSRLFETVEHEELLRAVRDLNTDQQLFLNLKLNELRK